MNSAVGTAGSPREQPTTAEPDGRVSGWWVRWPWPLWGLIVVGATLMVVGVLLPLRDRPDYEFLYPGGGWRSRYVSPSVLEAGYGWPFIVVAAASVAELVRLAIRRPQRKWFGFALGALGFFGAGLLAHDESVMTVGSPTKVMYHGDQAGPGAGLYVAGLGGLLVACGMGLLMLPGGVLRATAQRAVRRATTTLSGSGRVVVMQLPAAERLEDALPSREPLEDALPRRERLEDASQRRERLEDALRRGVPTTEVVQVAQVAIASALEADEPEVVAEIADRLDDEAVARGSAGMGFHVSA